MVYTHPSFCKKYIGTSNIPLQTVHRCNRIIRGMFEQYGFNNFITPSVCTPYCEQICTIPQLKSHSHSHNPPLTPPITLPPNSNIRRRRRSSSRSRLRRTNRNVPPQNPRTLLGRQTHPPLAPPPLPHQRRMRPCPKSSTLGL